MTAVQMWIGGILLTGMGLLFEDIRAITLDMQGLCALLYLAVACSVVGFSLFFYLIRTIGVARSNLVSYMTPAVAVLLGWLWLGETVGARELIGLVVILSGFTLVQKDNLAQIILGYRGIQVNES